MKKDAKIWNGAKLATAMAAVAGFLAFSPTQVRADDACQRETIKIDHNLHEAVAKHGPDSKEAAHWRSELAAQRDRCWKSDHKWWDEDAHRWHTERDWDEHDHDH